MTSGLVVRRALLVKSVDAGFPIRMFEIITVYDMIILLLQVPKRLVTIGATLHNLSNSNESSSHAHKLYAQAKSIHVGCEKKTVLKSSKKIFIFLILKVFVLRVLEISCVKFFLLIICQCPQSLAIRTQATKRRSNFFEIA